ncbi:hypothetical protein HIM_04356 [Hirsutella minnesotensis 3608]|uniref:Dystroglycan-type cadherin-like domain-containing protein n=1 Tax=Hirsutella minnesotensis 3608 TaxID=1043627 RepID=A0A0F8A612_9HYPO|nr:hypothetical protein HIM_04356 [Hirsutella minnesotensis 3608]
MASLQAALLALLLSQLTSAAPSVSFPLNSQLPPAARIDKFFSYSFSPYTFSSSKNITYSLGQHPGWLSLESDTRRLYGTPKDADVAAGEVVGQSVDIIAKDDQGETTMKSTLVVARRPPPMVQIPISKQIDGFGKFSAPSSILSYPDTEFTFSFDPNTFGDQDLNYYATSGDSSPLPAWVHFDARSLTFSGRTPPFESLVQPPQAFDLKLVASDIVGFAASSLSFSVVVGSHKLTADHPVVSLNASWGEELSYGGLADDVQIDGKKAKPGEVKAVADNLPRWLSFDPGTRKLKGTPGSGDHSTNVTVSFHDPFSDTLDVIVMIHVASSLFESTLDDIELRPGSFVDYDLSKHFRNADDLEVEVTTTPKENWLKVDGFKITGHVPKTAKGDFTISIHARSKSSGLKETQDLKAMFLAIDGSTPTISPHRATPTQSPNPHDAAADGEIESGHLSTGEILLATIIPIIFVTILLMLLVCYMRRRRARRNYLSSKIHSKNPNENPMAVGMHPTQPTMRQVSRGDAQMRSELPQFTLAKANYDEVFTHRLGGQSLETLGELSHGTMPSPLLAEDSTTARSVSSSDSDYNRESWVTVDGEEDEVSEMSTDSRLSRQSDTTFPESTRQLLPTPDFIFDASRRDLRGDFRSGLDTTIPTLENLSNAQSVPPGAYASPYHYRGQRNLGTHSNMTESSVALPSILESHYRAHARNDPSMSNWETIAESDGGESVSDIQRPDPVLLSSRPEERRRNIYELESSSGSRGFTTDVSFESSENWRVISPPGGRNTYKSSMDDGPLNFSRPSTMREGAQPGERGTSDRPSMRWRRDLEAVRSQLQPSVSGVSTGSSEDMPAPLSRVRQHHASGPQEHQAGNLPSDGSGSFKVFL